MALPASIAVSDTGIRLSIRFFIFEVLALASTLWMQSGAMTSDCEGDFSTAIDDLILKTTRVSSARLRLQLALGKEHNRVLQKSACP